MRIFCSKLNRRFLSAIGGPNTFLRQFVKGLSKEDIEFYPKIDQSVDIHFVLISDSYQNILRSKRLKIPIIQRLDGVTYPACSRFWKHKDILIRNIYQKYSDFIIFQSKFSRYSCETFYGITKTNSKIIYNGVDKRIFNPQGPSWKQDIPYIITTGKFRRELQIIPILEAIKIISSMNMPIKAIIIGQVTSKLRRLIEREKLASTNTIFIPRVPYNLIPLFLRGSKAFCFTYKSACPNSVIEAISCEVPIVGYDTGSLPELVNRNGILVKSSYPGWRYFPEEDPYELAYAIIKIINGSFRFRNHPAIEKFTLEYMLERYLDVFNFFE